MVKEGDVGKWRSPRIKTENREQIYKSQREASMVKGCHLYHTVSQYRQV